MMPDSFCAARRAGVRVGPDPPLVVTGFAEVPVVPDATGVADVADEPDEVAIAGVGTGEFPPGCTGAPGPGPVSKIKAATQMASTPITDATRIISWRCFFAAIFCL
jgi:hypothetical protein